MSDGNCSGSVSSNSLTERLVCIDRALKCLSDTSAASIRSLAPPHCNSPDGQDDSSSSTTTNLFARHHHGTNNTTPPTLQEITDAYAPRTLENQFQDLYRTLHPALVVTAAARTAPDLHRRCNASAFVQGPRGSGKTLLLNRVLMALADEIATQQQQRMFRLVYVNGILVPGHSVNTVVREILKQLSDAARHDNPNHQNDSSNNNSNINKAEQFLRLERSSFTNQLQLLSEILELACVDGVPVLFVLDELDTFVSTGASLGKRKHRTASISNNNSSADAQDQSSTTNSNLSATTTHSNTTPGSTNHQLLLYHLLERVATQGSFCSLVGLTTDSVILSRLEKRIQSRAEGTTQVVVTGPCRNYPQDLVPVLLEAIASETTETNIHNNLESREAPQQWLRQQVAQILLGPTATNSKVDAGDEDLARDVYEACELEHRLGRDVRWFRRVIYLALALYRHDLLQWQQRQPSSAEDCHAPQPPCLTPRYFEEALIQMGGALQCISRSSRIINSSSSSNSLNNNDNHDRTRDTSIDPDLRLQALRDLSGPQVALVLAARRILHRDTGKSYSNNSNFCQESAELPQLTLHRILHEYQAFYKGNSRYATRLLRHAFFDLLETGLFRPAADHSGVGPLQYQWRDHPPGDTSNVDSMDRMPLHLTVDIHREVKRALDDNSVFHCSTALREWGKHTH